MQSGTTDMDAWSQWNAQRATAAAAAPGFQPPGAYPAATGAAAGIAAPVPPAGAVPPAPGAPVGGYPMGYPYYGSTMPTAAVPGYNAQWAAMGSQQQNWQQWEQWQQQYAQWHQQYGSKYQAQMAAMQGVPGAAGTAAAAVTPTATPSQIGSGDTLKDTSQVGDYGADAYGQTKTSSDKTAPSVGDKRTLDDIGSSGAKGDSAQSEPKKSKSSESKKETLEELIEAEKAFDVQFKNWESQFEKWKEQNVNHPDKTQYREYESKWESWREQLLQKREQMKKKREAKMEEMKQETAKAAAQLASSTAAAAAATTAASVPPVMGAAAGYPAGAAAPAAGFPPMMTGPPPMFGAPFAGGYNQPPYGGPMPSSQQPPFMMGAGQQGPPPPPSMYPNLNSNMNMPPPMMNMGMPPMMTQPPPDVINSSNSSQEKPQNSSYDQQNSDPKSNNNPLSFVGSSNQGSGKGIPGLDLLNSGGSAQGSRHTDNSGGPNYQEPLSKNQPLLKTSDDSKAFDFPKNDQSFGRPPNQNFGSRFSGGPGSGPGSQSSYGQPSFGNDQNFHGNMQQPPSFSQFNLPPPKAGGGQFGFESSFKNKPGIPSLMDGFDSNRGPPPGLLDKKDNVDDNNRPRLSRFDDDFRGGPDSKFSGPGSRWMGNDSPAKSGARWGEPDIPPDESTSFSRGSFGSRGDMPDKFRSPGGPNDNDDRFSGPRGNFRDRFPPRGGSFDRPFGDISDSRPPFGDDKFGPKGTRDSDDRAGDGPGRYFGGPDKFSSRGFEDEDQFGNDDEDERFMGPRDGPDFPPRKDFGDRFSGPRGGPVDDPDDKPFGFNDGPNRFSAPRGGDDGPSRFGGGKGFGDRNDRNEQFYGSRGPGGPGKDLDKFPGSRGPNDNNDRFPPRFPPRGGAPGAGGGSGLLGDAPDRFSGPGDGPGDDDEDDRNIDGPNRFYQRGSDSGRGGFGGGGRFGSPRGGFDGPSPGGFGFRGQGPPGNRFGGPNDRPFDDRRGFGGPGDGPGDMSGDRFPGSRFGGDIQQSPGRFGPEVRGKNDGGPPPGPSKGPISLLDLPPIKPPPLIEPDGPGPSPLRGRPDMDFDDDRFASPNRNWGGAGPGPSPKDGPDDWKNRYPGGPGPSPDRLGGDWKMRAGGGGGGGGGPPPFPHEIKDEWELQPSTVVDYGHRPRPLFSDYDEPESLEPVRMFDYEHGTKRGSRWGGPDVGGKDSRMRGNLREGGPGGRDDRFRGPPPRGGGHGGGMNRDRDDNRDRDRNKGIPGRDDKDDRNNDKFRNNNSDFDNRKGGPNRNRAQNNRDRGSDDNKQLHQQPQMQEPRQPPVLIEDILTNANRVNRPPKIIIILRGPPGSGKTFVAKLIKDKEVEMGGSTPRILSLDDYFIVETEKEEKDLETGRKVTKKVMEYEYESGMEEHYRASLVKAFKKTISDGYFPFIVVDCVHDKISHYEEMYTFGKQNGFQVYISEMDMDVSACTKRNIHKRTEKDIERIVKLWESTPPSHTLLDIRSLLQSAAITEVDMEDSVQDETSGNKTNSGNVGSGKGGVGDDKDKTEIGNKNQPPRPGPQFGRPRGDDSGPPETNPVTLKRREKQIGYVKKMPEYQKFSEIVSYDKRREFHPMTPDINRQMSRRAWDNSIQQWKDKLKEWWTSEGHGLNYIRDYVKNSNNPEDNPENAGQGDQNPPNK